MFNLFSKTYDGSESNLKRLVLQKTMLELSITKIFGFCFFVLKIVSSHRSQWIENTLVDYDYRDKQRVPASPSLNTVSSFVLISSRGDQK